ncbi:helix-turn-helix domain-containing protein [Streptomyces sp. ME19-01-6]|uniref:winged helix-turn-helix transcriptional regulator n=1 Tax=Streptomyces sp. ME19-01-6 TaxID=3028686 RepID=UPI0029B316E8|nr:helix-turn-helix domain-containing protein [Streptomyces sp. ME19-01-6]MDX3225124.1 helix-turn-helix domain-containing protein [Streptomyces sp. ME19-01-6]
MRRKRLQQSLDTGSTPLPFLEFPVAEHRGCGARRISQTGHHWGTGVEGLKAFEKPANRADLAWWCRRSSVCAHFRITSLTRDGLITRTAYAEVPPRVEYELTPLGRSLSDTVAHVVRWVQEHQVEIVRNREVFEGADPTAR